MKKSIIKNISLGIACLLGVGGAVSTASVITFSNNKDIAAYALSGDGSEQNPYQIGSVADLEEFRDIANGTNGKTKNPNACAILTNDITFTGTNNWPTSMGYGWQNEYRGTFDGDGHTIYGLNHTYSSSGGGLFTVTKLAVIKNLTIANGQFTKGDSDSGSLGAFVQYAYGTTFINCHNVNFSVTTNNKYSSTGGFAGSSTTYSDVTPAVGSSFTDCSNSGTISGKEKVGGLVGSNTGRATYLRCYNTGSINRTSSDGFEEEVGGIVGDIGSNVTINNCYNTGTITHLNANDYVGGIVGNTGSYCNVSCNYSCGTFNSPSGSSRVGGIFGWLSYDGTSSHNYYLSTTATKGVGHDGDVAGLAEPLTSEQFKVKSNFVDWDFGPTWRMETNSDYPILGSRVVDVTLDNQDATEAGTTKIYEQKSGTFYLDEACTSEITTTAGITVPTRDGYNFLGYYSETEGSGVQFIDGNGYISDTADGDFFSISGTLYANWEIAGPQPATIDNIEDVNLTYGYASTSLTANASVTEVGTTLTYQWYSNTTKTNTDGTLIQGATSTTYNIPTGKDVGSYYYYCVVTSHNDSYGTLVTNKASNAVEVAVGKATPVLTAPTAKTGLGYDGSAQVLVNPGSTTGGTVLYKVDAGEYSSELPKATEIGTYVVSYKVDGGTNYTDIAEDSLEVSIGKGSINPVVTISDWTFSETASTPSTSGNPGSGEVTYQYKVKGADDSTYSIVVPTLAGEYTIKATVAETTNYLGGTATADFKIAQATPTGYDIPTGLEATYGDTLSSVVLPDNWAWKNPSDKVGNAGNREHIAIYTPTDPNYKAVEETLTVSVAKANPTVPTLDTVDAPYDVVLSTVGLPEGFSWMDGTQKTSTWGENTFKVKYTPADQANYNVIENIDVKVNVKWILVDPTQGDVSVTINSDNEVFNVDISVKVEVKTEITVDQKRNEYASLATKDFVKPNEDISAIYGVKLIRTTNGVEEEIQPSDIKPGTKITVSMAIPEELVGKDFRLLHIHSSDDITEVTNYAVSKDGKTLMLEVDRLSDFAFITATDADNGFIYSTGLPGWALALIIVGSILLLALLALLIVFIFFPVYYIDKNKNKIRKAIYIRTNKNDEVIILNGWLKRMKFKEVDVYEKKSDALNALNK